MAKRGRRFFHKFREKVKKQKEVMNIYVSREDEVGVKSYFEEREKLNELLLHEEIYWKKRAKMFWLSEGDTNSRFFHAQASKRKKLNHISHLLSEEGEMVDDRDKMGEMTKQYFTNIFTGLNDASIPESNTEHGVISREHNERLTADLTFEEFTLAIKQMHPDKASGPDGFSPAFLMFLGPDRQRNLYLL